MCFLHPKQKPEILIYLGETNAKCQFPAQAGLLGRRLSQPLGPVARRCSHPAVGQRRVHCSHPIITWKLVFSSVFAGVDQVMWSTPEADEAKELETKDLVLGPTPLQGWVTLIKLFLDLQLRTA